MRSESVAEHKRTLKNVMGESGGEAGVTRHVVLAGAKLHFERRLGVNVTCVVEVECRETFAASAVSRLKDIVCAALVWRTCLTNSAIKAERASQPAIEWDFRWACRRKAPTRFLDS